MDELDELTKIIHQFTPPDSKIRQACDMHLEEIERQQRKSSFALKRLKEDKRITEQFLNESIKDLEETTAQLREYQAKEFAAKDRVIMYREAQLQEILDAAPTFISLVDTNYEYKITNKKYEDFFGVKRDHLINKSIQEILPADIFAHIKPYLDGAFSGISQQYEHSILDQDENEVDLHVILTPATDLDGNIIGTYVYAQDITTLKEKENAINQKNDELQKYIASNLQLENFAYLASHDLRSPLMNVISFTKVLKESIESKLCSEEAKFLDFIETSSLRMQGFIDDLLSYALAKNREIEISVINLMQMLDETISDLRVMINETRAEIQIEPLPKKIHGDPILLKQVFLNLISNAIKFVEPGQRPMIKISCDEQNRAFVFTVSDQGIGIGKEHQEVIFGIFKKLHLHSEYSGTGIGLSTCRDTIKKHGGKIWVESEENRGSAFHFSIPK